MGDVDPPPLAEAGMTDDPRRDADTDIEEMGELGAFERRHRKVARSLGVSSRSLGLLWPLAAHS